VGCEWAEGGEHESGVAIGFWRGRDGGWDGGGDDLGLSSGSNQETPSASATVPVSRCDTPPLSSPPQPPPLKCALLALGFSRTGDRICPQLSGAHPKLPLLG